MDTSKIIKGVVNNGRYTVTAPIVKEDYGLYLQIEGVELPSTYEVDFSNDEHHGTSVTMIGNADGVLIPRQFIDTGKDVFAFLYHVGADFGRTVYKFRIPNKVRPDRTNEEPTPEEQSVIDQAINALNSAVEQTAQDVIDADASAQSASADAERAEEARSASLDYAEQAEASATSAEQSATASANSASASAQSASQSAQIKADVEDLADNAQGYAQASAQSASASANSASQAQGYARSASQSASGASASANTASAKAQDASTSAQTASQKATESAQSASQALTYKTDAESAKTASQTAQGLAESARDTAVQAKTDVQDLADGIDTRLVDVEADVIKAFPTDTASGAVASFSDGADNLPLKSLVVDINPVQDLSHGDPSPENICPISGWTGMQLNANGTVILINWQTEAGTVYGGKLDVLSGKLYVGYGICKVKDLSWSFHKTAFYATKNDVMHGVAKVDVRCDRYRTALSVNGLGGASGWHDKIILGNAASSSVIYIKDTTYASASEFKTAQGEMDIVYPLATLIEIQLTPHEVNSLLGQNNIFADTGDTACEYRADTKLYINKKIAEALASLT